MKKKLHLIKSGMIYSFLAVLTGLICPKTAYSQPYPLPILQDTARVGRYTSGTLHLLQQSTSQKRNTVRILVYGQSISAQDWWLEVKRTIQSRFPYSNLIMQNKSIGGFAAQILYKTTEMDVSSFYPDLVLLLFTGDNRYYDTVLYTIRRRTAAEIAILTDHYTGENWWSDTMSYHILPALAEKYKCDLINIRDPWKKYLKDHQIEPSKLTIDGTHLNDWGNFLMAELVKPLFRYKPDFPADPPDLQTTYNKGKDFAFKGDTLTLPFYGNRVDVIYDNAGLTSADSAKIFLDGQSPSCFQGTYFMTRPYNDKGDKWPWQLPAMIRLKHTRPWVNEQWYCIFTKVKVPYLDFWFKIYGSVSGYDGSGSSSLNFTSKSGKVIIDKNDTEKGGDWHLNRSYNVVKTIVNKGDTVKWKTYSISMDNIIPLRNPDSTIENSVTLFQGVPNTDHVLKIIKTGDHVPPVAQIRVYRPLLNQ
jgi:hypothetical protein